jgi:glycosyltransferase involved in cell wall biosynthesis
MRPRLLFVAPSSYTLGGLATWLDYLLPGLRGKGWEVCLGLVSGPVHNRPLDYLAAHPFDTWLPIHTDTCTPEGRRRALAKAIRDAQPDLAVSVNIPDLYATVGDQRRRGKPSPRALMALHGIQGDLVADARRYRGVLDGVIAVNRLAVALVAGSGDVPDERVYYAPCGVALPEPSSGAGSPGPVGALRIVYSGRLEQEQKRVGDLPPIVQGLGAAGVVWSLRIAGTGPDEGWLRGQFEAVGASGRIEFLGHVPAERMAAEVYAGADALLVTSAWETGPLVVWEAMAHGVPVVSTAYLGCGLEGALRDGHNCLLFGVGDAAGGAAALARLVRDEGLRARLTANGRGLVRERYSIEASVAAWDRALRAALALPRVGPPAETVAPAPSGRLDRFAGPRLAEALRVLAGRRWTDADAGGEWPHSHSALSSTEESAFWDLAARLDRRGDGQAGAPARQWTVPPPAGNTTRHE